jgi:NitT/TauT family transport system permease protein
VLLIALEIAARTGGISDESIPRPSEMLQAGANAARDGSLVALTLQTLGAAVGGLAIGSTIGLVLGISFGLTSRLNRLMTVSIECFRPIPSIALLPVAMMVYGLGYRLEISLVAFATSWPMLLFSRSAMASFHPRLREVGLMMGFSPLARLYKILLPAAMPVIFVGFRLAVGIALVVAVTVEITANPLGLGNAMMLAEQTMNPALMFALIAWTGVVGCMVNALLALSQRYVFGPVLPKEAPL